MNDFKDPDDDGMTEWERKLHDLIREKLQDQNIFDIEDAPDDLLDAADKEAREELGPRPEDDD